MIVKGKMPLKVLHGIYKKSISKGLRSKVIADALDKLSVDLEQYGFNHLFSDEIKYHRYIFLQKKKDFLDHFDIEYPEYTAIISKPLDTDDIFNALNRLFEDLENY